MVGPFPLVYPRWLPERHMVSWWEISLNYVVKAVVSAVLMVISWNLAVAMGIFFARHSKDMWPNHEPFGVKLWFTVRY